MKGLDNTANLIGLIISNSAAILFLITAIRRPKISRLLFFLLFSWACWINWKTAIEQPHKYLEYADLTFLSFYKDFINGWFSKHIQLMVGTIASFEGLIAFSMLLEGWLFRCGVIGGMLFLIAIFPLGVGSGFPCTLIFTSALFILLRKNDTRYLWKTVKQLQHKY